MIKISYLGPKGTFTEEALQYYIEHLEEEATPVMFSTIDGAILACEKGETDYAFVPIENSLGGGVVATTDYLAEEGRDLVICAEVVLPIRHYLWAAAKEGPIDRIYSHPQALMQCRLFLKDNYPGATLIETDSTASAAVKVSEEAEPGGAAVGGLAMGEVYELCRRTEDIQDNKFNATRFVVLSLAEKAGKLEGTKTSVICELDGLRPGSLQEGLYIFARRKINLVRIESRPRKGKLGEYKFFFDLDASLGDENLQAALTELAGMATAYKLLGSYDVLEVK